VIGVYGGITANDNQRERKRERQRERQREKEREINGKRPTEIKQDAL
jgi:hypothetical protein